MDSLSTLLPTGHGDPDVHHGARRRSQRLPLHADFVVTEPVAATGVVINASAGGLRVAVDRELEVGELLSGRVVVSAGHESMEHARVVWARELPDGWLLGLEFVPLN